MFKLDIARYSALFDQYKATQYFFPLIGAVLLNQQDGTVYVDDLDCPHQAYIEHVFGFAQVIGQPTAGFEAALERYLLIDRKFSVPKVRLYATYFPNFLQQSEYDEMRSFRQRFSITPETLVVSSSQRDVLRARNARNLDLDAIENTFGVVERFWRRPEDFIQKANAVVVHCRDHLAGVCYAAAEADRRVEIDVLTLPEFRRLGVGRLAVTEFVMRCFSLSLQPLWDCFTNNAGSMGLSQAVGFFAVNEPYPFFTISKLSR